MQKPKVKFSSEELKRKLSPESYHVTQEKGTEAPFTGDYYSSKENGTYTCIVCGTKLFLSDTKYDSGCGWPSFFAPADKTTIAETNDISHGMERIEVTCATCGAHLGHLFSDGPKPTGMRYCINSAALNFKKKTTDS